MQPPEQANARQNASWRLMCERLVADKGALNVSDERTLLALENCAKAAMTEAENLRALIAEIRDNAGRPERVYQLCKVGMTPADPAEQVSMPTHAPGQCPMCGEYSMAARARQGLYGVKVEL